jgi:hypothetical protein
MRRFQVYFVPEQARWGIKYFYIWPLFWTSVPHVWDAKEDADKAMGLLMSGKTYARKGESNE